MTVLGTLLVPQSPGFRANVERMQQQLAEVRQELRGVSEHSRHLAIEAAARLFPALRSVDAMRLVETIRVAFVGLRMQDGVTADKRHSEMVLSVLEERKRSVRGEVLRDRTRSVWPVK